MKLLSIPIVISGLYFFIMIFLGFRSQPKFCTWHMFANLKMVMPNLIDNKGRHLNIWEILPHTHLSMTIAEFDFFLRYLNKINGVVANGNAEIVDENEEYCVRIIQNALVN